MLERILLSLLCFSGWKAVSCLYRQYHYVDSPMTWTEAQTYCRQKHTDLALIQSREEMEKLLSSVSSDTASSVWIGLYSNIEWKWSDGYKGNGADYRHWYHAEPNFFRAEQFCTQVLANGDWVDHKCSNGYSVFCYRGTQQDPEFVFVSQKMDWSSAQRYCRENYIDLATVRKDAENQKLQDFTSTTELGWIGLYREPNIHWSDGNGSMFTYWAEGANPLASMTVVCGFVDLKESGKWKVRSCEERLPFVCYGPDISTTQTSRTKHVLKLKIKLDSSVDLNDPAVKADILKNLQDQLKADGLSGVTLKWRIQPDGKVFHKERKCAKMENRKRPSSEDEKCDL